LTLEGLDGEASGSLRKEYTKPKYKASAIFPMRKSEFCFLWFFIKFNMLFCSDGCKQKGSRQVRL
jgi:hypothetical protein